MMDTIWIDINIGEIEYGDNGSRTEKSKVKRRIELSSTFQSVAQNFDEHVKEICFQIMQEFKILKKELEEEVFYGTKRDLG